MALRHGPANQVPSRVVDVTTYAYQYARLRQSIAETQAALDEALWASVAPALAAAVQQVEA